MNTIQMLNLLLIVILILILILGLIAVILIYKMRKKKEPQNGTIEIKTPEQKANLITRDGKAIDSIYKFMEFDDVLDNMIVRKNRKQYSMVIECKGIN